MRSRLWQKAVELYQAALKQEKSRRGTFLQEACAGDEELLREVLSLLSGVAQVPSSLDSPGPGVASPGGGGEEGSRTASRGARSLPRSSLSDIGPELGRYSSLSPIGAGGMGEVFRARDLSLGRDVAIKVMHEDLASRPNLLRRFEREARAAAGLNHPNIATIYEVGDHGGHRFIAMELVDGRTLREMLQGMPLPAGEVIRLGTQIAGGLAKAHAAGIVHRDLKPGNLMVTTDGFAKILDFGLVKLLPHASEPDSEITGEGAVVGTVEYMAPEQAQAEEIDHRTDQFSLGVILYEMATGRRPFRREVPAQTLVAIIRDEPPPVNVVNPEAPADLARIIRRCMAKEPGDRYASTADLAADLARLGMSPSSALSRTGWRLAALAAAALAVAGVFWLSSRPGSVDPGTAPLQIVPLTSYPGREAEPTFSPDGSQVAFSWDGAGSANRDIYVKVIGSEQPLRLTSDVAHDGSPAWSPDGSQIAFLRQAEDGSEVRLVPPTGGPERLLARVRVSPEYGLSWSPDSSRLAAVDRPEPGAPLGLVLLELATGTKSPLTTLDTSAGRGDSWPSFSPDGRTLAFKRSVAPTANDVCLIPVAGGEARRLVSTTAITSRLAWTADGDEIVFPALAVTREGDALPVPSTRSNSGAPPVLWRVPAKGGSARQLVGTSDAMGVSVSGAGDRLAFTRQVSNWDVWRLDLRGSTPLARPARFIASTRFDGNAHFSRDDERVVFTSARSGGFEIWSADSQGGSLQRLTSLGRRGSTGSPRWSPDGKSVAFDFLAEGDTGADVFVVSASGGPPRRITSSPAPDVRPSWSKDGRFIYFGSHRSGEWQVWKVAAAGEGRAAARQVTRGGGYSSIESRDGQRLYFSRRRSVPEDPDNAIWEVPVEGGKETAVIPSLGSSDTNWDVADEGIYYVDRHEGSTAREHWVINFFSFASRRVSEVAELEHPPRLGGPALSVSSDRRWLLVSQQPPESDLMLIESFR